MKTHLASVFVVLVTCLLAALSTGSTIFLCVAMVLAVVIVLAFISVWQAGRSVRIAQTLSEHKVNRGAHVVLTVSVSHRGLIPIAPVAIQLTDAIDIGQEVIRLKDYRGRQQRIAFPFDAVHVGALKVGIRQYTVEDMFGLFSLTKKPAVGPAQLLVLPMIFDTEDLRFAPGDSGLETLARATEDVTSPADVRAYQPGDPLKKIHWKLSMRKGELMVRRFEEPALPDALVLLDCSPPPLSGQLDAQAYLKDILLETAASVVSHQMLGDNPVRLPLLGSRPIEFDKSMGLPLLLEELARLDFSQTDRFERVLLLETRRMRRTGATVIITARLNSSVVDMVVRIRRMGPHVRLYLCTFTPEDEQVLPLISRLQQNTVEVCYVAPGIE